MDKVKYFLACDKKEIELRRGVILQKKIENYNTENPKAILLTLTSGLSTWRKGSNIAAAIAMCVAEGWTRDKYTFSRISGAHLQHGSQGWQWAIFGTPKN